MKPLLYSGLAFLFTLASFQPSYATSKPEDSWHAKLFSHISQVGGTPQGYSPSQIRHAYSVDQTNKDGAGQTIGIISAYSDPNAETNLATFNNTFNLPKLNGTPNSPSCTIQNGPLPCFQKVVLGSKPKENAGWSTETSLDTEWSHVMAPKSSVLLVEANSDSLTDLLTAIDKAVNLGAYIISMSWGGSEFSQELADEAHFSHPGISFVASSGDSGFGTSYPASSPHVISVGGTHLTLTPSNTRLSESAWSGSGGGASSFFPKPLYQQSLASYTSKKRLLPDVSLNADPTTGYPIFNKGKWLTVGGTSASAPQWAGIIALANQAQSTHLDTSSTLSSPVYTAALGNSFSQNYWDTQSGKNGTCKIYCSTKQGYDTVTGLGSPIISQIIEKL